MNKVILFIFLGFTTVITSQNNAITKTKNEANNHIHEGNKLYSSKFELAEIEYRKALSKLNNNTVGAYNLANAYYEKAHYDEALFRQTEAAKTAATKDEKHRIYHNIGNTLMQQKDCKKAVEAFKNALRNNPTDEESRYNLALAQECAKNQGGGSDDEKGDDENKEGDDDKEKSDGDKEGDKDKKNQENKDDKDSKGNDNKDKKDGDDNDDDQGKPKDQGDDKKDGDPNQQKNTPQQPQPGKLSPQQVKNLLEAMNNQEKKVQDKINAKKVKGVKVKTDKDW